MFKTFLKFLLIVTLCHTFMYYVGIIMATAYLGVGEFMPPSPNPLSYLKNPTVPELQPWILLAQLLRGVLLTLVLWPFRERILQLGVGAGGFAIVGITLVGGYIAAGGGTIEHFLYFQPADYPMDYAVIRFGETLMQTILTGAMIVKLDKMVNAKSIATRGTVTAVHT